MDFAITQILRETNFEESTRSSKTAIFAILRTLNFVHFCKFQPSNVKKVHKYQCLKSLNV